LALSPIEMLDELTALLVASAPLPPRKAALIESALAPKSVRCRAVTVMSPAKMLAPVPIRAATVELLSVEATEALPAITPPLPATVLAVLSSKPSALILRSPSLPEFDVALFPSVAEVVTLELASAVLEPMAAPSRLTAAARVVAFCLVLLMAEMVTSPSGSLTPAPV
jgi:hypothetical protein